MKQVIGQKKKNTKECAPYGISRYDQMKDDSLCTVKLQAFENFF